MSVGVHAIAKIGDMKPGANVVVFGAGPVGLLTAAVAKGLGARLVIAVGE
jgi:D-xylulose reductase